MMFINILDENLNYCKNGVLDDFISFQYSEKYVEESTFEIKCAANAKNAALLKINHFVCCFNEQFTGLIDSVQISLSSDGEEVITASGYDLKHLFRRRIITTPLFYKNKSLSAFIANMVSLETEGDRYLIKAGMGFRNMADAMTMTGITVTRQVTVGNTLYDEITAALTDNDCGWRVFLDSAGYAYLKTFQGEDRTQNEVITRQLNNIVTQDYTLSNNGVINTVYATCEEDFMQGQFLVTGGANKGLDRFETILQSTQKLQSTDPETGNQVTLTQEELLATIEEESISNMIDRSECFDADLINVNLSIGDLVKVIDKSWDISYEARVIEIQNTFSNGNTTQSYLIGKDVI